MKISPENLHAWSLAELREVGKEIEQQVYDRRCQSYLTGLGPCTGEPPHADGWHETSVPFGATANPAHTAMPHPAVVRWRFADDVVALEHEHEARRRPGAN